MIVRVSHSMGSFVAVWTLLSVLSLPLSTETGSIAVALFTACSEKHGGGMLSLDKVIKIRSGLEMKENSGIEPEIFEARCQRRQRGWGSNGEEQAGRTMRLRGGKRPKSDAEKLEMWSVPFVLSHLLWGLLFP